MAKKWSAIEYPWIYMHVPSTTELDMHSTRNVNETHKLLRKYTDTYEWVLCHSIKMSTNKCKTVYSLEIHIVWKKNGLVETTSREFDEIIIAPNRIIFYYIETNGEWVNRFEEKSWTAFLTRFYTAVSMPNQLMINISWLAVCVHWPRSRWRFMLNTQRNYKQFI